MDSASSKKELKHYSRNELFFIRKEKLKIGIISAKKLLGHSEPLKVADEFIHDIIELMENGLKGRFPNLNREEVQKMIKNNLLLSKKIKKSKKRGSNSWPS